MMSKQSTRREALKRTALSSAGFVAWLANASPTFSQEANEGQLVPFLDEPRTTPNRLDWEALDTWLTPQDQVFSVQHYGVPKFDYDAFRLEIGGMVKSPKQFTVEQLKAAFGPVIDKLTANGIDLTKMPVEVAPIAHYHMGGIAVDETMATGVPQLLAAGEAVGGANGANRLSGNAITEALVFGRQAGRKALDLLGSSAAFDPRDAAAAVSLLEAHGPSAREVNTAAMLAELQSIMWDDVGPFRTAEGLTRAVERISALDSKLGEMPVGSPGAYDMSRLDWFDLRNMLLVARVVTQAALMRTESRGAHQRYDYPGLIDDWTRNQIVNLEGGRLVFTSGPLIPAEVAAA
jgi:succinate dehydrogenase/fumarate reductase flavoprotein subunit